MNGFDLIIKPDEEDADAAEVLVDGTVGGNHYHFLLDTGAARSSVAFDDYTSTLSRIISRSRFDRNSNGNACFHHGVSHHWEL